MPDPLLLPLCQACAATYAPGAVPWWTDPDDLVRVFLSEINGRPCFTYEGTKTWEQWIVDFVALEIPLFDHLVLGPVHAGISDTVRLSMPAITGYLSAHGWPDYYVAGHSKGAGEATLLHGEMKALGHTPLATRAYEPPRVGSPILSSYLRGDDFAWTETINAHGKDLVTAVPFGPTWAHEGDPVALVVPDTYEIPQKHEIAAVLAAVQGIA